MPKDFAGKNKTAQTYDKDWVFVKNKQPKGPNVSMGAWMTKDQAHDLHEEQLRAKAEREAKLNQSTPVAPGIPTAMGTAPIDMSGMGTAPVPAAPPLPMPTAPAPGVPAPGGPMPPDTSIPSWWIGNAITNPSTPEAQFANVANALLPTLAPEDQRTLAAYLAQNHKDVFGGYSNTNFGPAPTEITDAVRKQYLSPQRAQLAVNLLDRMKTASGATEMGGGYDFLKNAVNLINQFAVDGVMTREKYAQFTNAVSNLSKNATGNLSAYGNLAQLFNLPQFSAGPLVSNTPNSKLFG